MLQIPGFRFCFWSAQFIQRQARTFDNVKTWVFSALSAQWWFLIDKVVYCNNLHSSEAPFLEVEKTMFTAATLVPIFIIINPDLTTCSKQTKTFHANFNLKVYCEKKCLWRPKKIVWMLQTSIIQSNLYATQLTSFLYCLGIFMTIVSSTCLMK